MSGRRRMLHAAVLAIGAALAGTPRAADSPPGRAGSTAPAANAPTATTAERDIQHALGLLDYVAGDYAGAVGENRRIRHADEYDEQKRLLQRAETLLAGAPGRRSTGALQEMHAVRAACAARHAPSNFVPRVRRLHARIVRESKVHLSPQFVPSLAVGRIVYAQACAVCHGEDGAARSPQAAALEPHPLDFAAADFAVRLSPYTVFNAVTYGVPGTAMASFEALPEEERWAVAFWVLSLRHAGAPVVAPAAGAAHAAGAWQPTVRDLAFATDADLGARVGAWPAAARAAQVAHWRTSLPLEIGD